MKSNKLEEFRRDLNKWLNEQQPNPAIAASAMIIAGARIGGTLKLDKSLLIKLFDASYETARKQNAMRTMPLTAGDAKP